LWSDAFWLEEGAQGNPLSRKEVRTMKRYKVTRIYVVEARKPIEALTEVASDYTDEKLQAVSVQELPAREEHHQSNGWGGALKSQILGGDQ
jgi:hypothetical protein